MTHKIEHHRDELGLTSKTPADERNQEGVLSAVMMAQMESMYSHTSNPDWDGYSEDPFNTLNNPDFGTRLERIAVWMEACTGMIKKQLLKELRMLKALMNKLMSKLHTLVAKVNSVFGPLREKIKQLIATLEVSLTKLMKALNSDNMELKKLNKQEQENMQKKLILEMQKKVKHVTRKANALLAKVRSQDAPVK